MATKFIVKGKDCRSMQIQIIDRDISPYWAFVLKDEMKVPIQNDDETWEIYVTNEKLLEALKKKLKSYGLEIIKEVKVDHFK